MTNSDLPPVVFLAFANDHAVGERYLRNLDVEADHAHSALSQAEQRGHCEVVIRQNATADDVLDIFQDARYRDRVAIFHFGGHANSFQLLLETSAGKPVASDGEALAAFLAQQRGLQVVFLNGCSTEGHVIDLLNAGVNGVIATERAIDDAVATTFSERFYQGMSSGAAIGAAFAEATAGVRFEISDETRDLGVADDSLREVGDRIPWHLHVRPGAEAVKDWSLPKAVNDPLFGLPSLPPRELPASPFRYLNWYDRDHAEVFFGRGSEIRDLFQRVSDPDGASIILLYGQSGAGKSSLLAAGLLPRLESDYAVVYARREAAIGLVGTLQAAISAQVQLPPGADVSNGSQWLSIEQTVGKPLAIVLDQVEEAFTQPRLNEMMEFLELVQPFTRLGKQSKSRLILSFRKEWLAELEKLLVDQHLPYGKVFLERLGKHGIAEAVDGLTQNERLGQHYGLTVSSELPSLIADDLLEDAGSAIAPTLQVLLTKMWQRAKALNGENPRFDLALYHELKREGLLLRDFLDQQLQAVQEACPHGCESGLALDILEFHATSLGTAKARTLDELRSAYDHCEHEALSLVAACRDQYLLVDPVGSQSDGQQITRLAHDTLAPLVREMFVRSQRPGQIARRILENQITEWVSSNRKALLNEWSLEQVEAGRTGMRDLTEPEIGLVDASRKAIEALKPPVLDAHIFPPSLRVRKFVPGKVLSVYPYFPRVQALLASSCIGFIFSVVAMSILLPLATLIVTLLTEPLRSFLTSSQSDLAGSYLSMICYPLMFFAGPVALYFLITRRSVMTFNFASKRITTFVFFAVRWEPQNQLVSNLVKPSGSGFRGELRFNGFALARTDVMPTEEAVRNELAPFGYALNNAMGFATPPSKG